MGLDMYAYRVRIDADRDLPDVDAHFTSDDVLLSADGTPLFHMLDADLHYWRKHPDLHGWMERLYHQKGGQGETFNCRSVRIVSNDLDQLEQVVNRHGLPLTTGFFFGQSSPDCREDDLVFIAKAREAIAAGDAVYYDSWW